MAIANMGGDLYLEYDGAEKRRDYIGHDIRALSLVHKIKGAK